MNPYKLVQIFKEMIGCLTYIFLVEVFLYLIDKVTGHESIQ